MSIIKLPEVSNDNIIEIKRRLNIGVTYSSIRRNFDLSYYEIKKICRIFNECNSNDSVQEMKNDIEADNREKGIVDHRANYQRYKPYYTQYNQDRQQRLIRSRNSLDQSRTPISPTVVVR